VSWSQVWTRSKAISRTCSSERTKSRRTSACLPNRTPNRSAKSNKPSNKSDQSWTSRNARSSPDATPNWTKRFSNSRSQPSRWSSELTSWRLTQAPQSSSSRRTNRRCSTSTPKNGERSAKSARTPVSASRLSACRITKRSLEVFLTWRIVWNGSVAPMGWGKGEIIESNRWFCSLWMIIDWLLCLFCLSFFYCICLDHEVRWLIKIHEKIYIEIILSNFIKQNRKEVSLGTRCYRDKFSSFYWNLTSPIVHAGPILTNSHFPPWRLILFTKSSFLNFNQLLFKLNHNLRNLKWILLFFVEVGHFLQILIGIHLKQEVKWFRS